MENSNCLFCGGPIPYTPNNKGRKYCRDKCRSDANTVRRKYTRGKRNGSAATVEETRAGLARYLADRRKREAAQARARRRGARGGVATTTR